MADGAPKLLNPLAVIFMFFSFSEVMLGYAVFNTAGWVQVALTVFVIAFPLMTAAMFFYFLWHRPENLYAPRDFASDEGYLRNMLEARQGRVAIARTDEQIRELVTRELTSQKLIKQLSAGSDVRSVLDDAASELVSKIRDAQFFTISFDAFDSTLGEMTVPVDGYRNVGELTNDIYYHLSPRVRPHYYGVDWVLKNATTGEIIQTRRMIEGIPVGRPAPDKRSLENIGVRPGSRLLVVKPQS
jgi:hypothetical protein